MRASSSFLNSLVIFSFLFSFAGPATAVEGTWRKSPLDIGGGKGLFRSDDAGSSWRRIHERTAQVLALDPQSPGTLYAAGVPGVAKSTDGVPAPLSPCRVYAGTGNRGLLVFTKSGCAE